MSAKTELQHFCFNVYIFLDNGGCLQRSGLFEGFRDSFENSGHFEVDGDGIGFRERREGWQKQCIRKASINAQFGSDWSAI